MKVIILAAGFAAHLHPLTLTQPKPLLKLAGRPLLEHMLDNLASVEDVDQIHLVSNSVFAENFRGWAHEFRQRSRGPEVKITDDGARDEATRLGAIGDLNLVLENERIDDDILVVAGDNLFSHPLKEFGRYCRERGAPVLGVYDVESTDIARKYGVVSIDKQSRVTRFEEKPEAPSSTLIGIGLYYYPATFLPRIREYIEGGHNADQPGRLVQWLYPQTPFYAWTVPGIWYDIGSKETLEEAGRILAARR